VSRAAIISFVTPMAAAPWFRCTVVPVHRGEAIGRGLLAQILRDCEITRDDLRKVL